MSSRAKIQSAEKLLVSEFNPPVNEFLRFYDIIYRTENQDVYQTACTTTSFRLVCFCANMDRERRGLKQTKRNDDTPRRCYYLCVCAVARASPNV